MRQIFLVSAFLVLSHAMACGADYYVDKTTGTDDADGTSPQTAFLSFRRAVRELKPGDTLHIAPAETPYSGELRLGRSGLPGAPIVIEGGGSVLSGLVPMRAKGWQKRDDGTFFYKHRKVQKPYLLDGTERLPQRNPVDPGSFYWEKDGCVFRPAEGKTLEDYNLIGTLRRSGVRIHDASYIVVRDLVCEHYSNDGFNVHGDCQGLLFERIEGRYNGDDGFSIHEEISAVVHDGYFHHNTFGIQDVNLGSALYDGVVCTDNLYGIHLLGGSRRITNSVVTNNRRCQIRLQSDHSIKHVPLAETDPVADGIFVLKNVLVGDRPGVPGLQVQESARVSARNLLVRKASVGVEVEPSASLTLVGSILQDCPVLLKGGGKAVLRGYNLYHNGAIEWGGTRYALDQWQQYVAAAGGEEGSRAAAPVFGSEGLYRHTGDVPTFNKRPVPIGPMDPLPDPSAR